MLHGGVLATVTAVLLHCYSAAVGVSVVYVQML